MTMHRESAPWHDDLIVASTSVPKAMARAPREPAKKQADASGWTFVAVLVVLSAGLIVFSIAVHAPIDPGATAFLGP
jgi:hypothetical protein